MVQARKAQAWVVASIAAKGGILAVASKKQWQDLYGDANPFRLPQEIARRLRQCTEEARHNHQPRKSLDYVWIYVGEEHAHLNIGPDTPRQLTVDEWLTVVDEAAALGADSVFISLGCDLSESPEVLVMCRWAQHAHDMLVGLHVFRKPLSPKDLDQIAELDQDKLSIFADPTLMDAMQPARERGINLLPSKTENHRCPGETCEVPKRMPCIGACGEMYTCGLVLGEQQYRLGNVFDRELNEIMTDTALPHTVPRSHERDKRECHGCPPLMAERLKAMRG